MCGIAGILTVNQYQDNLQTIIQGMQAAIRHRGPDDSGIYIAQEKQVALAHTRLAILDLSLAGHQPMSTSDGRYWIVFNGEIYNFEKIRQDLISQGEEFKSQTDTEIILKLYQRVGSDCVRYLRGMFAFAIWDDAEKTCFLARDPLGIKPLYYWQSGSTLVFASELKSILASRLPAINLSAEGLYGYLISGSVPEPNTLIEGVYCLNAGHSLHWQAGKISQKQYWQIDFTPAETSLAEAQAKVRAALINSIHNHFVSDVPVGIFLSGGIDSTAVLALARQTQKGLLKTYSIAFAESEWNEGEIASKAAQEFDTEHTEYKITADLAKALFPKFLETIDQPSIDGFNTFCVSKVAHDDGTKVVLSGLGGDELFGGYGSFQKVPQMVRLGRKIKAFYPINIGIGKGLENWARSPKMRRLGDFLQQPPDSGAAYRSFRGIFSHQEACKIAQRYLPDHVLLERYSTNQITSQPTLEDEVSLLEISGYMRNQLLRDSDVMSMAWGLELRVPLVDRVLVETISSIPSNLRLMSNKQLLIQAVPELPTWVYNRPKRGFYFPFQQWLQQEWHECFQRVPAFNDIPLSMWYRRWSLALFQHWWENISN
ncbi:asparagine synthase (glutamine-hydrolyzing) [Nostocaceae cyanobacterium CENA357]|uniref:asparagine synthase (glutamine-hydrolyzing) n=1 Tax=Atlanticothrix silvestris CENA357 TaxID=1725252 RepID=A0A8J7L4Z2_9CYAN|nr:asparagine synthase (glutamine-hydrolyzing) [Atlanticothrix silvestris]MBH8555311.1 asparagine synthase (glutamine-hydrolyzing) [Atlanticothrix silvestris CENA357]